LVVYDNVFGISFFNSWNGLVLKHTGIYEMLHRLNPFAKFSYNLLFLEEALHTFSSLEIACIYYACFLRTLRLRSVVLQEHFIIMIST